MVALNIRYKHSLVRIALHIPDGIAMDSYPGAIEQIVSNLVENAVVHAFEGRAQCRVNIAAQALGERVVLTVTDNGNGIPAEHQSHIFDPLFTTRLGKGGSGLGLSIAYGLVTGMLGGQISVNSAPGAGARFTLDLPLDRARASGARRRRDREGAWRLKPEALDARFRQPGNRPHLLRSRRRAPRAFEIAFGLLRDLLDTACDVLAHRRLLAQGIGDRRHRFADALGAGAHFVDAATGATGQFNTGVNLCNALTHAVDGIRRALLDLPDLLADLARRAGRAFGQLAHLVGNHGEAAPPLRRRVPLRSPRSTPAGSSGRQSRESR